MSNIVSYGLISKELVQSACVIDEAFLNSANHAWIFQNEDGDGIYVPVKSWVDLKWTDVMSIANIGELYRQTGYTAEGKPLFAEYEPKNNKLNCSPYSNITIETPGETLNVIKPENVFQKYPEVVNILVRYTFEDTFKCYGTIKYLNIKPDSLGQNYKNYSSLIEIPIATTMPGDIDNYWQYVNSVQTQRTSRLLQGAITGAISVMSGNYGLLAADIAGSAKSQLRDLASNSASMAQGVVGEGISQLSESLAGRMNHGTTQVGTIGGNMFVLGSSMYPRICLKQVDPRYIKSVDEYFSKYGYKVSYRGIPNLYSREKWNYIKTIGCKIAPKDGVSFMNNDAKIEIQNIYDKGIRFWHGDRVVGNFGNYDNPIV